MAPHNPDNPAHNPDRPHGLDPAALLREGLGATRAVHPRGFSAPSLDELRDLFPHLEILAFVGQGGMGAVYKARQPGLDRVVALKVLPVPEDGDGSVADPTFAERFEREAQSMARLSHPHIATVFDFGRTDRYHFLLMEFVDGPNLRQVFESGGVEPSEALLIIPQLCEGLAYAHECGIVHRDIKPENILLRRDGQVKVVDFGLAKLLGAGASSFTLTGQRDVLGTVNYMAPEQMERPTQVDHRADIYSLGVVFYEMLTGELPLGRFAPPSRRVEVDVRLDEVVLRALEKEPEARYQSAQEMKTRLLNYQQEPPQPATGWARPVPPNPPMANSPMANPQMANSPPLQGAGMHGAPTAGRERLSLAALFGFLFTPVPLLFAVAFLGVSAVRVSDGAMATEMPEVPNLRHIFALLAMTVGGLAPVASTALGFLGLHRISRAGGQLYGKPIALVAALCYPLLVLDAIIMALTRVAMASEDSGLRLLLGIAACVLSNIWIVRATWRAYPVSGSRSTGSWVGVIILVVVLGSLLLAGGAALLFQEQSSPSPSATVGG